MKLTVALVLLVSATALVSASDFFRSRGHGFSKSRFDSDTRSFGSSDRRRSSSGSRKSGGRSRSSDGGGAPVDASEGGSDYHFSWKHAGKHTKWSWSRANGYCTGSLGAGWEGISINSKQEDSLVKNALGRDNVDYIWTSGRKSGRSWKWASGSFEGFGWSSTGFHKRPQPDNRDGNEDCLAVLNRFYPNDGITWHDVGCSHKKPIICERKSK